MKLRCYKYSIHKVCHFNRLVTAIGDAYGIALLLHMLTTTITLTLLAYQATKVSVGVSIAHRETIDR